MDQLEEENVEELATVATEDLTLRRRKLVEAVGAEDKKVEVEELAPGAVED